MNSPQRFRVLAVDDDPGLLRVVSRILSQHYEVACASGSLAALAPVF